MTTLYFRVRSNWVSKICIFIYVSLSLIHVMSFISSRYLISHHPPLSGRDLSTRYLPEKLLQKSVLPTSSIDTWTCVRGRRRKSPEENPTTSVNPVPQSSKVEDSPRFGSLTDYCYILLGRGTWVFLSRDVTVNVRTLRVP